MTDIMRQAFEPITTIAVILCLGGIIHLAIRSREWSAPIQDARFEWLERDHRTLRGNLLRVEREAQEVRREHLEIQDAILKELRAIHTVSSCAPLEGAIGEIRDRIEDMEQAIAGLPCGQVECIDPEGPKTPNDAKE